MANQILKELQTYANKNYDGDINALLWGDQTIDGLVAGIQKHYDEITKRFPNAELSAVVAHYFC